MAHRLDSSVNYVNQQQDGSIAREGSSRNEAVVSVAAGAFAGAVSCFITNPIDTLRVRLAASRDATGQSHKSLIGHLRLMFSHGIVDAVGKGLLINIMASSPCNAVYMWSYRYLSKVLSEPISVPNAGFSFFGPTAVTASPSISRAGTTASSTSPFDSPSSSFSPSFYSSPLSSVIRDEDNLKNSKTATATTFTLSPHLVPFVAATGGVILAQGCLCPLLVIRTRVQINPKHTALQYTRIIYRESGIKGFFRGVVTNVSGRAVEEGLFWFVYESLKRTTHQGSFTTSTTISNTLMSDSGLLIRDRDITTNDDSSRPGGPQQSNEVRHAAAEGLARFIIASCGVLGLSGFSKLVGTALSYPYNVVMIHQREVDKATGKHLHTKLIPTLRHIYAHDGLRGFYKGLSPHLLRSVLSKATQIYVFELVVSLYEVSVISKKCST